MSNATAYITIADKLNLVNTKGVTIHNVSAEDLTIRSIEPDDRSHFTTTFTTVRFGENSLHILGTADERVAKLRAIAHQLNAAAAQLEAESADSTETDTETVATGR